MELIVLLSTIVVGIVYLCVTLFLINHNAKGSHGIASILYENIEKIKNKFKNSTRNSNYYVNHIEINQRKT